MDRLNATLLAAAMFALIGVPIAPAAAATSAVFELVTPLESIQHGQSLAVEVRIDSAGQNINAAEVHVKYNPAVLRFDRFAREQSIFTLWPQEPSPTTAAGEIVFVGGRPGGIFASHSTIATLYFTAQANGLGEILVDPGSSQLTAHDGRGTLVPAEGTRLEVPVSDNAPAIVLSSATHPEETQWYRQREITVDWPVADGWQYSFLLTEEPLATVDETIDPSAGHVSYTAQSDGAYYFLIKGRDAQGAWTALTARRLLIDATAPEPFMIAHPDPADVDGKNILTWSASDAASGVVRTTATIGGQEIGTVTSPLLMKSGWGGKTIVLTAIDGAGNARSATWSAARTTLMPWRTYAVGGGLFVALVVAVIIFRPKKRVPRRKK